MTPALPAVTLFSSRYFLLQQYNNITNHLIGVMDDETANYLSDRKGINWFRVNIAIPESQKNTHPANRCVRVCALARVLVQTTGSGWW